MNVVATSTTSAIPAEAIRLAGSRTPRFEGSGISFFLVTNDPGHGPALHRHPYTETWVVLEGEATITIGGDTLVARAGDTAVIQPDVWHRFENTGTTTLRLVCIHASPMIIQEFRDDAAAAR